VARDALMNKSFTVAICSLNGEKFLPSTLNALFDQISQETKVILVDDGSSDRTSEIAKQYGIEVIKHKQNMGYGQARQSALDACQTEILAFIDDSCVISSEWFFTLQKDWQEMSSSIIALAGPVIPIIKGESRGYLNRNNPFAPIRTLNGEKIAFLSRLIRYFFPQHSLHSGYIESVGNGNLSFRVAEVGQIGGYNINLFQGGEDDDLCTRIQKEFGPNSIYFDEKLWVTYDAETFMKSLHRSYRYGGTSARAWLRNGGIPTVLPIPAFFASVLLLSISSGSRLVSIGVLITYPIVISKVSSSKKSFYKISTFVDPYVRLIHEIANNLGFISVVVSIETFLNKLRQERKEDKNEA
jgi:glycosyltransferase involved in cell wall biosynthesis